MSTVPKSFSHNNMQSSESKNLIELEEEGPDNESNTISKDKLVVKRIQKFAQDMKSKDNEDSDNKDESEGAVSEDAVN